MGNSLKSMSIYYRVVTVGTGSDKPLKSTSICCRVVDNSLKSMSIYYRVSASRNRVDKKASNTHPVESKK